MGDITLDDTQCRGHTSLQIINFTADDFLHMTNFHIGWDMIPHNLICPSTCINGILAYSVQIKNILVREDIGKHTFCLPKGSL